MRLPPRAPYRASLLTRVLRRCFVESNHRTVIVATASPTPTDLQHTLNTLDHMALMSGRLAALRSAVAVSVPLHDQKQRTRPVHAWTTSDVAEWVAAAEGGRFAHLVLPPGLDGAMLLKLGANRLSQLFAGTQRAARGAQEGAAWTVAVDERNIDVSGSSATGRALFRAVRNEQQATLAYHLGLVA